MTRNSPSFWKYIGYTGMINWLHCEERETPIACVSSSTPASCFVHLKNEKK